MAEVALVGALPVFGAALEVGEVLAGDAHRLGFVGHGDVDDAVGNLH